MIQTHRHTVRETGLSHPPLPTLPMRTTLDQLRKLLTTPPTIPVVKRWRWLPPYTTPASATLRVSA